MTEEKKTYSIIGKVEIGTDEYRDLIESVKNAEKDADRSKTEYWKEYSRANEAEKRAKDAESRLTLYSEWLNAPENEIHKKALLAWRTAKAQEQAEESL